MEKAHPLKIFQVTYKFTGEEMASAFGVTLSAYNKWLSGDTSANQGQMAKLRQVFTREQVSELARDWIDWMHENE